MSLSESDRKALNKIESSMGRKDFAMGDIIGKATPIRLESAASAGGGAAEAMTFTGLKADDVVLSLSQRVPGANSSVPLGYGTQIVDGLTVTFDADPGAGAILVASVLRVTL